MEECKLYLVDYSSEGNIFTGQLVVRGELVSDAQDVFLEWLKGQDVYKHLWNLRFSITLVDGIV